MFRRSGLAALALAACVALAGCGRSGFQYLSDGDETAFAKIPADWEVVSSGYTDFMLSGDDGQILMMPGDETLPWHIEFTADPNGQVRDDALNGDIEVQPIDARRSDTFDIESFSKSASEAVEVTEVRQVRSSGLTGYRVDFAIDDQNYRHTRLVLTDARKTKVYVIEMGCEATCFEANSKVIDEIIRTFTVRG